MNSLNINKVNFWELNSQKFNNKVFYTSHISSNAHYYPKTKKKITNENFNNSTFFQSIGNKNLTFPNIRKMPILLLTG